MQVKVFEAGSGWFGLINRIRRQNLDQLEHQVNRWLKDNPEVKVVEIKQSAAGGGLGPMQLLISLWHESAP